MESKRRQEANKVEEEDVWRQGPQNRKLKSATKQKDDGCTKKSSKEMEI